MKKYIVSAQVTVSIFTEVEALDADEAEEIAEGRLMQGFCHQCATSRQPDEEWSLSGELDGEATELKVEEK